MVSELRSDLKSAALDYLDAILSQVPPDANPYSAIADAFRNFVVPTPRTYSYQIIALSAIFALLNLMVVVSLTGKRSSEFWVFHVLRSSRGTYLHPHLGIARQLCTVVFLTGLQVYVWALYYNYHGNANTFLTTFGALVYFPSWLGGWLAAWALGVSKASLTTASGVGGLLSRPGLVNVHFLSVPFISLAALCTCCGFTSTHFRRVFRHQEAVAVQLQMLSAAWNSSIPTATSLEVIHTTVAEGIDGVFCESDTVAQMFQRVWIAWFIIAAYLYLIFSIIAFLHFDYLRRHIITPVHRASNHHHHLRRSLATLVLAVLSIAGIGFSFCGLAGWLAFGGADITSALSVVRLQTHLNLWMFAVFGSIASAIFLLQSVGNSSDGSRHTSTSGNNAGGKCTKSRTAPLEINVEVVRTAHISRSATDRGLSLSLRRHLRPGQRCTGLLPHFIPPTNTMLKTRSSVRNPSFFGPFALAAALLLVTCISEPIWQNFYILEAKSLNTTMKMGAWGVCTRLRCTPKMSGYTLKFVENTTGINQFPTGNDDEGFLLGLNSVDAIPILSSSQTSVFWLHVVGTHITLVDSQKVRSLTRLLVVLAPRFAAAVLTAACVGSLVLPPTYLGNEDSVLFKIQKSGLITAGLAVLAFLITIVTFAVELAIIVPAKDRLNAIEGIHAQWGNIEWYAFPSALLMLAAIASVLMAPSKSVIPPEDEYPLAKPAE
ncbi:hypothetical protein RQP46_002709 [Phenoliferia psychrophenolica]